MKARAPTWSTANRRRRASQNRVTVAAVRDLMARYARLSPGFTESRQRRKSPSAGFDRARRKYSLCESPDCYRIHYMTEEVDVVPTPVQSVPRCRLSWDELIDLVDRVRSVGWVLGIGVAVVTAAEDALDETTNGMGGSPGRYDESLIL